MDLYIKVREQRAFLDIDKIVCYSVHEHSMEGFCHVDFCMWKNALIKLHNKEI